VSTEENRLSYADMSFATHYTEGKQIAKQARLEHVISNKTVSLTSRLGEGYAITDITEHCVSSQMTEEKRGSNVRILLECSREWDRIQLTPFFSSTFETVVYENRVTEGNYTAAYHQADVLVQIVHEEELELLIP
jgi:hypothetical protein